MSPGAAPRGSNPAPPSGVRQNHDLIFSKSFLHGYAPAGDDVVEGVEDDLRRCYARGVERPVVGACFILAHGVEVVDGVARHLAKTRISDIRCCAKDSKHLDRNANVIAFSVGICL